MPSAPQGYRRQAPSAVLTGGSMGTDEDYDYAAAEERAYQQSVGQSPPPPPPPPGRPSPPKHRTPPTPETPNGNDPLLDLEQLEELHEEAERMKALGNKHMAAQEYTRAYNAYSAALQLSPVGPSSHVFLSNRAAALLSLKRYAAAATDARRAVALAPTFGKAHARLGQSLYFLKDYEGAVASYQEAIRFEPDNAVTLAYLEKAKTKLARQHERARRGDDMSSLAEESSVAQTVANSIATDPNASAAVVTTGFRGDSRPLMAAARGGLPTEVGAGASVLTSPLNEEEDPDFNEAVRIQEYANKLLATKRYKEAIDEYSAALFLVPDDPYLSPELHLGRAHALNGCRRHESAKNDATLAIKINPTSEAYSTLAKSLFYMKDYLGAVAAFEDCMDLLPPGESLSMFDQAYLRKAEAAWKEELESNADDVHSSTSSKGPPIPKLPPPRFVPREKAINSAPNMPPLPKQWPQQSQTATFTVGPERNVTFLSESLGIKLNRGSDGIVRVLTVSPETPSSPIARSGTIEAGDVVREAAGVDIRRPITNIMWGDTIAFIKIAPRPITLVVAKELSPVPPSVLEERERAIANSSLSPARKSVTRGESKEAEEAEMVVPPSPANGEESVRDSIAMEQNAVSVDAAATPVDDSVAVPSHMNVASLDSDEAVDGMHGPPQLAVSSESVTCPEDDGHEPTESSDAQDTAQHGSVDGESTRREVLPDNDARLEEAAGARDLDVKVDKALADSSSEDASSSSQELEETEELERIAEPQEEQYSVEKEMEIIGGEILFERRADDTSFEDWSNLRWLSTSGDRKLRHCELVIRTIVQKGLFRSGEQHLRRKLAIYEKPSVILLLRPPNSVAEVRELLDLPDGAELQGGKDALRSFLVAESVIDPVTCKLRLSPLTTITSVGSFSEEKSVPRRRTSLELVTPTETIALSALSTQQGEYMPDERTLAGGPAFLETAGLELAISKALFDAHRRHADPTGTADVTWKHQIVQGTLTSYVLSGNNAMLEKAIKAAMSESTEADSKTLTKHVRPQIIDAQDESGRTALHYACLRQASTAVSLLTKAGASCAIPIHPGGFLPSHLSALVHDEKSLSIILSASYPVRPDPNQMDALGRTPMYLAAVEGKSTKRVGDAGSLGRCLSALEAWGGQMVTDDTPSTLRHPVSSLAARWLSAEIAAVLAHVPFRYPTVNENLSKPQRGISVGASCQYPIHSALVSFRNRISLLCEGEPGHGLQIDDRSPECALVGTLRVLLEHGFEPNERIESITQVFDGARGLVEYVGFSPLQILSAAAIKVDSLDDSVGAALKHGVVLMIAGAVDILASSGARLSLDPPPTSRLARRTSSVSDDAATDASAEEVLSAEGDREAVKNDGYKTLVKLVGKERLKEAQDHWSRTVSVEATDALTVQKEACESSLADSEAPGGSDDKTCAICWKSFGTLRNRKHKCRVSLRYVCEECSSKRIVDGGAEYRVSDGQFCLARNDAARKAAVIVAEEGEKTRLNLEKARAMRKIPSAPSDEDNRDSLFGGVMNKAASLVFGEESDGAEDTSERLDGLSGQLSQTRDALNERGTKLSSLGEKTARLADSSADFAKMAKELERSQKGMFW